MFTTRMTQTVRHAALCIGLVSTITILLACGCSSSEQAQPDPTGKVAGTVTLAGKPLKGGSLMLISLQSGSSGEGTIDKSGKFEFTAPVPPGEYTVFFAGAPVPEKYQSETSSDCKVTVTEGSNDLKIDLE